MTNAVNGYKLVFESHTIHDLMSGAQSFLIEETDKKLYANINN